MCGINGFNFIDREKIEEMVRLTAHRGPDDSGIYEDDEMSLGHNRLAIIDLTKAGHQPMHNSKGNLAIIYNGELYNYPEIKKELEVAGKVFKSNSDTEVIIEAYDSYGEKCLDKFNGIFAFAIWDKQKKELFCARDHLGVKPLFYYWDGERFIFSSEIKSILSHNIPRRVNYQSLNLFFYLQYINGPATIIEKISKLPPGHFLRLKKNQLTIQEYWRINNITPLPLSRQETKEKIKETFASAVKRQLIADVPVGVFLSGGLDSSSLLLMMTKLGQKNINTFSVGYELGISQEKFNSDAVLAKRLAKELGANHHELYIKEQDVIDSLEKVVWHMDDLVSNPTQSATLLLSQVASRHLKVVLGGDGGDELYGGYKRYYLARLLKRWQLIPKILRNNGLTKKILSLSKKEKYFKKLNLNSDFEIFWSFMALNENLIQDFLQPEIYKEINICKRYIERNFFYTKEDVALSMMLTDLKTWLADESLARSDKMTMAHSLEYRVPILDKEMIELAARVPTQYKLNSELQGKQIFKEVMSSNMPDYIYNKRKTGWFSPSSKWLRSEMKSYALEILSSGYNEDTKDILNFKAIENMLDKHILGSANLRNTIWPLLIFQIWYRKFISQKP